MPDVAGVVVQVPVAYAAEVAPVCFFWLLVEVLEDECDVVPVLHEEGVCVVNDDHLNRRKEIVVLFLGTASIIRLGWGK